MLRVIIVDDEIIVRVGLMSCIKWEDYGYEIVGSYETGAKALAAIPKVQPDIVFTDIRMPVMDGLELIQFIRDSHPHIQIVVLSCLNDVDYVKRAIKMGAEDYILKLSLTPETLGSLLNTMKNKILAVRENMEEERELSSRNAFEREQDYRLLLFEGVFPEQRERLYKRLGYSRSKEGNYVVCCCLVDDFADMKAHGAFSDQYLMRYALLNVICEFLEPYPFSEAVSIAENECFIVIRFLLGADIDAELSSYVSRLNNALKTHLNMSISCGVSEPFTDPFTLHSHYVRAREIAGLRFFHGRATFMTESGSRSAGSRLPAKGLPQILQAAVDTQNREYATQKIEAWFDAIAKDSGSYLPQAVQAAVVEAWVYISEYSLSRDDESPHEADMNDDLFSVFWNAEYLDTLKEKLLEALDSLLDVLSHNRAHHPTIIQFCHYLEEHVADHISLSEAAARCYLSKTYFCSLFKKETGENFVDYFSRLKMERARQLLMTRNMKVYEAGNAVGISDMSYFNKLFRKHFGVSPGQIHNDAKKLTEK